MIRRCKCGTPLAPRQRLYCKPCAADAHAQHKRDQQKRRRDRAASAR